MSHHAHATNTLDGKSMILPSEDGGIASLPQAMCVYQDTPPSWCSVLHKHHREQHLNFLDSNDIHASHAWFAGRWLRL